MRLPEKYFCVYIIHDMNNFQLREKNNTVEIDIIGSIDLPWFSDNNFEGLKLRLDQSNATEIILNISSLGGNAAEGFAMYDLLKAYKKRKKISKTTANIFGATASAGTLVAMGADEIQIAENAFFLIHNTWTDSTGDKNELRETANQLEIFDNRAIEIYTAKLKSNGKTGDIRSQVIDLMNANKWIDAAEAKNIGLVDSVNETVKIAAKAEAVKQINKSKYLPKFLNTMSEKKAQNETDLLATIEMLKNDLSVAKAEAENAKANSRSASLRAETNEKQLEEQIKKNADLEVKAAANVNASDEMIELKVRNKSLEQKLQSFEQVAKTKDDTIETLKQELNNVSLMRNELLSRIHRAEGGRGYNSNGDFVPGSQMLSPGAQKAQEEVSQYSFAGLKK